MPDPSCICDLHHSSRQYQIFNPLSRGRDWIRILMGTSWVPYHWATTGTTIKLILYSESWFMLRSSGLVWQFLMLSETSSFLPVFYFSELSHNKLQPFLCLHSRKQKGKRRRTKAVIPTTSAYMSLARMKYTLPHLVARVMEKPGILSWLTALLNKTEILLPRKKRRIVNNIPSIVCRKNYSL